MRKLASIQRILDIQPIPNSDKIDVCTVLGWKCVIAKKDNFKIGDQVVYIEVDSVMPEKPEFEFLRDRKFRVKTIRLRGQISQGLVLPVSVLPKGKYSDEQDVTDILGVKKFDPEGDLEKRLANEKEDIKQNRISRYLNRYNWFRKLFPKKSYRFPEFIQKTDETRIQAIPHVLEQYKNVPMLVTEKVDGQSFTAFLLKKKFLLWETYEFGVCSRNLQLKEDNSNWWCARKYNIKNVLKSLFKDLKAKNFVVIQGEIVGNGIQGNKYNFDDQKLFAFNLIVDDKKYSTNDMILILDKFGIESVPLLGLLNLNKFSLDDLVLFANNKSVLADTLREGIVLRDENNTVSFKVISPEFLLKHGL